MPDDEIPAKPGPSDKTFIIGQKIVLACVPFFIARDDLKQALRNP